MLHWKDDLQPSKHTGWYWMWHHVQYTTEVLAIFKSESNESHNQRKKALQLISVFHNLLSQTKTFFSTPYVVTAVWLCSLCTFDCVCILANIIHLFDLTPKPTISSLHFLKSPEVCLIISSALVKEGYLCWGCSERSHSHETEKKKIHLVG